MWQLDEITIAEEHFVSNTVVALIARIVALAPPAAENGRTVVAATLEGDPHDIGMQAVCALFEMDGWRLVPLGSGLPVDDLVREMEARLPDADEQNEPTAGPPAATVAPSSGFPPTRWRSPAMYALVVTS